jgi:hypothetical protein
MAIKNFPDTPQLMAIIEYLELQKTNPTFPLMQVHKGYNFALDILKEDVIQYVFEEYCDEDKNHDVMRELFEDETLDCCDHWNKETISMCNDGRDDFKWKYFCEEVGIDSN